MEESLETIHRLYSLLDKHKDTSPGRVALIKKQFEKELSDVVDTMEDLYYTYFLKRKSLRNLVDAMERSMKVTRDTMNVFLPYMILHSMNADVQNPSPGPSDTVKQEGDAHLIIT